MTALTVLLTYLAGSSASLLENTLVEREQIASAVYYDLEYRPDTVIRFLLSSVDTDKLRQVETRFFEVLRDATQKSLDMVYMKDCIQRRRRQEKFTAESSRSYFTNSIITDYLFGNRNGSTLRDLETLREYDELETWTDQQWRDLLAKWISGASHITILGKPSAELSKKLKNEEKARVAAQKARLGESGLKELEKKLAEAKAENDKEIPREILEGFKVPDTSSIHFISTTTARSGAAREMGKLNNPVQDIVDRDHSTLPLFIHFEHIQSNFVHLTLLMGTSSIPLSLRPLLTIYLENFFDAPIMRERKKIDFEQVVMELEKDTVGYTIDSGSGLGNPEILRIKFQVENEKYETAIRWLKDLLWNGVFDIEVKTSSEVVYLQVVG